MLGPNGAGKTTAVRILATLLAPDAASARIDGYDVVTRAANVRRSVGLTGQYASVDEALTGRQNLVMIGQLLDLSGRAAKVGAAELLEWFDLTDAADRPATSTPPPSRSTVSGPRIPIRTPLTVPRRAAPSVGKAKWRRAARGQGLLVRRRLHVHRAGKDEDRPVEIGDHAGSGRGRVGWNRRPRVGKFRDPVRAHANGNRAELRQRGRGRVRGRAGAEGAADPAPDELGAL
jgi:ABC transporter